jgi:hypothetical protein
LNLGKKLTKADEIPMSPIVARTTTKERRADITPKLDGERPRAAITVNSTPRTVTPPLPTILTVVSLRVEEENKCLNLANILSIVAY